MAKTVVSVFHCHNNMLTTTKSEHEATINMSCRVQLVWHGFGQSHLGYSCVCRLSHPAGGQLAVTDLRWPWLVQLGQHSSVLRVSFIIQPASLVCPGGHGRRARMNKSNHVCAFQAFVLFPNIPLAKVNLVVKLRGRVGDHCKVMWQMYSYRRCYVLNCVTPKFIEALTPLPLFGVEPLKKWWS